MGTTTKNIPAGSQVSKAQTEVWEWKEKASEELNLLSKKERITFLKKREKAFLDYFKTRNKKKHDVSSQ